MPVNHEPTTADRDDFAASDCPLIDLGEFRLDGDYAARVRTERHRHVGLFVTKELKGRYFHIKGGEGSRLAVNVLVHEGQHYLLAQNLWPAFAEHLGNGWLHTVLTTQGRFGLWYTPRRSAGKASSSWNDSAVEIAMRHAGSCIRLHSNSRDAVYEPEVAAHGTAPAAEWPPMSLAETVERAFGSTHLLQHVNHPILQDILRKERK